MRFYGLLRICLPRVQFGQCFGKRVIPDPLEKVFATPAIVLRRDGDNDFRPLYFVPWIPGIKESQDRELNQDGLRDLTARVLTYAQSHVGRAPIPSVVSLCGDELLRDATFGIFDRWRDEDRNQFSKTAVDVVEKALGSYPKVHREGQQLDINLDNAEDQDKAIKCLETTDPSDPEANLTNVLRLRS